MRAPYAHRRGAALTWQRPRRAADRGDSAAGQRRTRRAQAERYPAPVRLAILAGGVAMSWAAVFAGLAALV